MTDLDVNAFYLEPEDETGNCEYKYQLIDLKSSDVDDRASQMNFRLDEGGGEALYKVGITDDGCPLGLTQERLNQSIETLKHIAQRIDALIQVVDTSESVIALRDPRHLQIYEKCLGHPLTPEDLIAKRYLAEVLVRRQISNKHTYVGIRIAVAGNVDASKTTTIGVLTQGILDDGNGLARKAVFKYKHELDSGRTSSVGQEILGFDAQGQVVNERLRRLKAPTWPEIVRESTKIVSFYDMAGHAQYFNTTIRGISGTFTEYGMIMIGANMGISQMTREHMIICLMRGIPMIILLTKIDITPAHVLQQTLDTLNKLLTSSGVNKTPYLIKDRHDVMNCCHNMPSGIVVPIIKISNVTGENLDILKLFLNCLPPRINYHKTLNQPAKFTIQEIFHVTGIGTVVNGFLMSGVVNVKDSLWLGPDLTGKFSRVTVKSIHDKRIDISTAFAGNSACFALRGVDRQHVAKGMMLIDGNSSEPKGIREFTAWVEIFGKNTTSIRVGYEPVIHIANIKQAAAIIKITDITRRLTNSNGGTETHPILRAGDKARVVFRFVRNPVYFEAGAKILFRENLTRGVGLVESVTEHDKIITLTVSPNMSLDTYHKIKKELPLTDRKNYRKQIVRNEFHMKPKQ